MIERLLAAESALEREDVELAGRLFAQVSEADPRNAIAVVGLARVAQWEGRRDDAKELAERALAIDPEEAAAARLLRELLLGDSRLATAPIPNRAPVPVMDDEPATERSRVAGPSTEPSPAAEVRMPSLLDRLRNWLGLGRRD